ncbi:ferritin-like domain-containing protein [Planotetraspora sp. GP83]|uniref:ferritin-like domain-containing protein n=1 Tax=Planotetraspora sp. GP83 TaxID=3156264 RepID=UPI003513D7C0
MTDALAKALAAEHAAVYAYGVVGGKTTGRLRARASIGFDAHRARRDQLRTLIAQRGGTPSEPGPTYQLPFEITTASDAVRLAVLVEERLTTAYLELAADPDASLRRLAALAAQECATRAYGWRPAITAFPGMPGLGASPTATAGPTPSLDPTPPLDPSSLVEEPADTQ